MPIISLEFWDCIQGIIVRTTIEGAKQRFKESFDISLQRFEEARVFQDHTWENPRLKYFEG